MFWVYMMMVSVAMTERTYPGRDSYDIILVVEYRYLSLR